MMGSSTTGVSPIGTKRDARNMCTSVNGPCAGQLATTALTCLPPSFAGESDTSLPTLNTCSMSSVWPLQNFSAQPS
jgi:hypothetical protein